MYDVIGSRASRAFRVLWMLEELGVAYKHTPVAPRSPEAMAANPSGKVPAMQVGDVALTESVAIMAYLGDKHGKLTYPAGTLERARQDALTQQILDEIDALLWTAARHGFILPEEHRVPAVKDSLKWEYTRNIARLADRLQSPFLMGDTMTTPDILLTHCLRWAEIAKFPGAGDALTAYRDKMEARPAFQKTVSLP